MGRQKQVTREQTMKMGLESGPRIESLGPNLIIDTSLIKCKASNLLCFDVIPPKVDRGHWPLSLHIMHKRTQSPIPSVRLRSNMLFDVKLVDCNHDFIPTTLGLAIAIAFMGMELWRFGSDKVVQVVHVILQAISVSSDVFRAYTCVKTD